MKKIIVYYSLEGNTRFVAQAMAEEIGADLLELKPLDAPSPTGFMKYVWGGRQVFMKEKPVLEPFDKRPEEYDLLLIGTPVWAFSYAPALASFFSNVRLQDKKIALFCCSGGGKGRTLQKMRDQLQGNQILGEVDFIDPARKNAEANRAKAKAWARDVGRC